MATTIKLKNSVTTTNAPTSLVQGEVAINVTDKKVWVGNAATTPVQLLGTGADGSLSTLTVGAGTVSLPSITTTGDTNTGIFFPAADTIAFTEGGAEAMRIDSSGNVGIGTASPSYKLDVNGISQVSGLRQSFQTGLYEVDGALSNYSSNNGVYLNGNATGWSQLSGDGTRSTFVRVWGSGASPANFIAFNTAGSERGRFDSSGNLCINQTSATSLSKLNVTGTSGQSIIISMVRPGEANSFLGCDNAAPFRVWDSASTNRFAVTSAGSCQNTTGSYGAISDAKLKENIVDATPKLDDLMKVKVRNYGLKAEENSKFIGFIAQELREVFPSIIEENLDEDENGKKNGEVTLSVKTTVLIPILVKAIQEQQAIITDLKSRITALESK